MIGIVMLDPESTAGAGVAFALESVGVPKSNMLPGTGELDVSAGKVGAIVATVSAAGSGAGVVSSACAVTTGIGATGVASAGELAIA